MSISDNLNKVLESGKMSPFIKYIVFPKFKNLEFFSRIDFDHPITAIVGPNGTNKSSILRALQGAPQNENIGNYWFETALDHINMDEKSGGSQRYYYGYTLPSGGIAEVLQTRVAKRDRGLDYFETHAPSTADRMKPFPRDEDTPESDKEYKKGTRWVPIKKSVVYLDFRQEIPAYDIYMSFDWRNQNESIRDKKNYIRKRASRVNEALDKLESSHLWHNHNRIISPAIRFKKEEVDEISKILGREYDEIRLVKHEYFKVIGYTAKLVTKKQQYSEAYAGSGEFAATMLVHRIYEAPNYSLILLDEPETSLHPGAQKALTNFLQRMSLKKKLQIVMSTHAPAIIENLPPNAIKILDINPRSQHVFVCAQEASPSEAFNRIGASYTSKSIIVEDDLAKEIVTSALKEIDNTCINTVEVLPYGGANHIINNLIPAQSAINSDCNIILDGDQRPSNPPLSIEEVPDSELEDILRQYGIHKPDSLARSGGNDKKSLAHLAEAERITLSWILKHVKYLPSNNNPEAFLLELMEGKTYSSSGAKKRWKEIASEFFGQDISTIKSVDIFYAQKKKLADFIKENGTSEFENLINDLKSIIFDS